MLRKDEAPPPEATMRWDPQQYGRYADERGRPFADLTARIDPPQKPKLVVDLGCGPGLLTASLAERWPDADVIGVDSSPDMIAQAVRLSGGGLEFVRDDLRTWTPPGPVDVLVANASLHWVPDHLALLPALVSRLAPGGMLGLQVPHNFDAPSHLLLHALRNTPRWRDVLGDEVAPDLVRTADSDGAAEYLRVLTVAGCEVDAWDTTYLHVLPGDDPVLEWMRGTGARPTLAALPDADRPAFEAEYAQTLRQAYPRQPYGTVFPFRRVFAVGRRGATS
jgi:trans-aconitate 2-methyltransferase